jgi:hypothetical protein
MVPSPHTPERGSCEKLLALIVAVGFRSLFDRDKHLEKEDLGDLISIDVWRRTVQHHD